jgi:hypothetical protein
MTREAIYISKRITEARGSFNKYLISLCAFKRASPGKELEPSRYYRGEIVQNWISNGIDP